MLSTWPPWHHEQGTGASPDPLLGLLWNYPNREKGTSLLPGRGGSPYSPCLVLPGRDENPCFPLASDTIYPQQRSWGTFLYLVKVEIWAPILTFADMSEVEPEFFFSMTFGWGKVDNVQKFSFFLGCPFPGPLYRVKSLSSMLLGVVWVASFFSTKSWIYTATIKPRKLIDMSFFKSWVP